MATELALHDIYASCVGPLAHERVEISDVVAELRARLPAAKLHPHMPDAWSRSIARAPDVSAMTHDDFADAWNSAIDMCAQQSHFDERFEIVGQLGAGAFATVHLAFDRQLRATVAIKTFSVDHARRAQDEAKIWSRCVHENIIRHHGVITAPRNVYFVIELAPGGELLSKIDQVARFDEEHARAIFRQCAEAVCYLHDNAGVAHRDIKPENLLCTSTEHGEIGTVKLTDFGFAARIRNDDGTPRIERGDSRALEHAKRASSPTRPPTLAHGLTKSTARSSGSSFSRKSAAKLANLVGTPDYMAPEQVRMLQRRQRPAASQDELGADEADDDHYDESVDCWALGCIAYELLNGSPPFVDEDDDLLNELILHAPVDMSDQKVWGRVSAEAKDLIMRLLDRDALTRLTAREALQHPWLQRDAVDEEATSERFTGEEEWQMMRQHSMRKNRAHVRSVRDNRRFRVGGLVVNSIVRMAVGSHSKQQLGSKGSNGVAMMPLMPNGNGAAADRGGAREADEAGAGHSLPRGNSLGDSS